MSIVFSVNLNKVSLLRNSRGEGIPDFAKMTQCVIDHGADGITLHPRPDVRHVSANDVSIAKKICAKNKKELNIEGNPFSLADPEKNYPGYYAICAENLPTQCTLVPDGLQQKTSDHGWNVAQDRQQLKKSISDLKKLGTRVSIFMDVENAHFFQELADMGADCIELYTQNFAQHFSQNDRESVFQQYIHASKLAHKAHLRVNAGHDLNLLNLRTFRQLPHLSEVSIGHALISEALYYGLPSVIKSYKMLLSH